MSKHNKLLKAALEACNDLETNHVFTSEPGGFDRCVVLSEFFLQQAALFGVYAAAINSDGPSLQNVKSAYYRMVADGYADKLRTLLLEQLDSFSKSESESNDEDSN